MRDRVAHAGHGANDVGARAQVRDLAAEFERVRLGLNRIGVGVLDAADHFDATRLDFERLALRRRRHDVAGDDDRAPAECTTSSA
jgi:hypothetical protein